MTGNFTLTLPIMLVAGIASAVARRLTYGSIYTTKLLRRGIDIERPRGGGLLQRLTAAQAMQPLETLDGRARLPWRPSTRALSTGPDSGLGALAGELRDVREPRSSSRTRVSPRHCQVALYGHAGLPVLSHDGSHVRGWITQADVLRIRATSSSPKAGRSNVGPSPRMSTHPTRATPVCTIRPARSRDTESWSCRSTGTLRPSAVASRISHCRRG